MKKAIDQDSLIASGGIVLRLYWMPVLLWLDRNRAELFIDQLNGVGEEPANGYGGLHRSIRRITNVNC